MRIAGLALGLKTFVHSGAAVSVFKKELLDTVDGTPSKRLFLSIISDYDLKTGLCELIDNALDQWMNDGKKGPLLIDVSLNVARQTISVADNGGGVDEANVRLLIAPGASRARPHNDQIGIFGVGGKRAAIALGEYVEIRTRRGSSKSIQIDLTPDWLVTDEWEMPVYQIPDISPDTTSIEIFKLRREFTKDDVYSVRVGLGETYARFLEDGCTMRLNEIEIQPLSFGNWAYPPNYLPRQISTDVAPTSQGRLSATLTAGLITDRDGEAENYGVYFYCNNRLILKEYRGREVGYVSGEAGVPHPDASLCRVIVELNGPADLMPWNSSKTSINFNHPAVLQLRSRLIDFTRYYSTVSRRLKNEWSNSVFAHASGNIDIIGPVDVESNQKTILPDPPRTRRISHLEDLRLRNRKLLEDQPWTIGLIEAMGFIEVVQKHKLDTRNRIALILLDSNLEIALKEFIVHRKDFFPPHKYDESELLRLFSRRSYVVKAITTHVTLPQVLLDKAEHYYGMRNKLIHERTTATPTDKEVVDYQSTVEEMLTILFEIKFPRLPTSRS